VALAVAAGGLVAVAGVVAVAAAVVAELFRKSILVRQPPRWR
jgi:hypothetical protein